MQMTLRIRSYCGQPVDNSNTQSFVDFPVIIGRSSSCDYVLNDASKYISSNHAVITVESGIPQIQDTSANGVYLNGDNNAIGRGNRSTLSHTDSIALGDYCLIIELNDTVSNDNEDPFLGFDSLANDAVTRTDNPYDPFQGEEPDWTPPSSVDESADIMNLNYKQSESGGSLNPGSHEDIAQTDSFDDWPVDWDCKQDRNDSLHSHSRATQMSATPVKPQATPVRPLQQLPYQNESGHLLESFYKAAGLDPSCFETLNDSEVLANTGKLLNLAITGLMTLLHSRKELKHAMRSDLTSLSKADNNPLKFSHNAEEAILKLLSENSGFGYLSSEKAMNQAVEDLKLHQLAMLDGMKAAASSTLDEFDPRTIAIKLEKKHPIAATIPMKREAELWRLFQDHYAQIRSDAIDDFDAMFSREFRKAYEKRIYRKKK
ncbi:MAG: type VI secretion system-associated FHA domain protein TagH [Granulosicoccus sp.]